MKPLFPLKSAKINQVSFYYSTLFEDVKLSSFSKYFVSTIAYTFTGSWLAHSFIVINYINDNKEGELSLDFD